MRPLHGIIVHCTATTANWWHDKPTSAKVAEVKRWHTLKPPHGRGWKDIGYHYLIDRDGTVATGRPLEQVGAHVQGHNTGTIGISLFGGEGSNEKDQFSDHFTQAQDKALRGLISKLKAAHGPLTVTGHNQYAAKACPGFYVPQWFAGVSSIGSTPPPQKPASAPVAPAAPADTPQPFKGFLGALLRLLWSLLPKGR
jgi:N-acetylmuramoyl-L-alanine amidase